MNAARQDVRDIDELSYIELIVLHVNHQLNPLNCVLQALSDILTHTPNESNVGQ